MVWQWYQGSPEKKNQKDNKLTNYLLIGIGSRAHGVGEVPQSAICKLETQESWWYKVWKGREEGAEARTSIVSLYMNLKA